MKQIYFTNDIPKTLVKFHAKRCLKDGMEVQFHYVDMLNSILTNELKKNADLVI